MSSGDDQFFYKVDLTAQRLFFYIYWRGSTVIDVSNCLNDIISFTKYELNDYHHHHHSHFISALDIASKYKTKKMCFTFYD